MQLPGMAETQSMALYDTRDSYGTISRINHWLGAAFIIGLLWLGLYFHEMPTGDERLYWLRLHVALAALSFLLLAFRVVWRFAVRSPDAVSQPRVTTRVTRATHGLLLFSIVFLLVTGPLMVWTLGRPIAVFDWFAIPSPLGKLPVLHEALEGVHAVVSRVLLVLIVLHVLGALKHMLVDRNGAGRMIGSRATAASVARGAGR